MVIESMAISGTDLLEVPTICTAYFSGLCKSYVREYPHKIWPYMVRYLHFRILIFSLIEYNKGKPMVYISISYTNTVYLV